VNRPGIVIVGGGPAGLRAAEVIAGRGIPTRLFEQKGSPGRKFLIAGRGGLNITHSEPLEAFVKRYDEPARWTELLKRFTPSDLVNWFHELRVKTYVGTSGRVFPLDIRVTNILERWLERLDRHGCDIQVGHRLVAIRGEKPFQVVFEKAGNQETVPADGVVLALGGASWPQTGSDMNWLPLLQAQNVAIKAFEASNVGWERQWSPATLTVADGHPLKNLEITWNDRKVRGELLITSYGMEGGAIYQLTRALREKPRIEIDFKPDLSPEEMLRRWKDLGDGSLSAAKSWRLSGAAVAVVREIGNPQSVKQWIKFVKRCPVEFERPRPLDEAISSSGGIAWGELTDDLMLKKWPGIFCAGEMIDWDAPTGGYLMQGCFVTGSLAGDGAAKWFAQLEQP
jgi:uncharacterized flavoprotein (TIGR03862 family)